MPEENNKKSLTHNVILKNRENLSLSGILDVESFDDTVVIAHTSMGELKIEGEKLHIEKINLDSGDLCLEGNISAIIYKESGPQTKGFFAKLFK